MNWQTILATGAILFTGALFAQTPDGQTPAGEAVCDPLQDDGVTKGLYGLCVAFCEAQDYADEWETITEEELEALEDSSPSGRILANYNKKKTVADPDMPCILVQEPCPCWSSAELAEIDGIMWDGQDTSNLSCITDGLRSYIQEASDAGPLNYIFAQVFTAVRRLGCQYRAFNSPGYTSRNLSVESGTISVDEVVACTITLNDYKSQFIGTKDCLN